MNTVESFGYFFLWKCSVFEKGGYTTMMLQYEYEGNFYGEHECL